MSVTSATPNRDGQEPLAALVEDLRAERDGLRAAIRTRALIEQAKGILMVQHRIDADVAFDRLRDVSQRTNTRLVEVAAGIVAQVSPPPTAGDMMAPADRPRFSTDPTPPTADGAPVGAADTPVRDGLGLHTQHLLLSARLESAGSYDEVVAAVADATLGWPRLGAVVLALAEPDGALRVAASRGAPSDTASQWVRIPPQVDVPLTAAARLLAPVWLADAEQVRRAYPLLMDLTTHIGACVALPLLRDGRLLGVLGLTWRTSLCLDESRRSYLLAATDVVGRAAARLARRAARTAGDNSIAAGIAPAWIQTVLDASLDPAVLLTPVRVDGQVRDFVFEYVNEPADDAAARDLALVGTTVLTAMPHIGARVLLPLFRAVLADGDTRQVDDLYLGAPRPGHSGSRQTLRAVRLGQAVVVSWRTRSAADVIYADMVAAGRAAGIAAFRWQLSPNELRGSPNLWALIDWPAGPPPTPRTVGRAIDPVQWSALRRAAVSTLRTGAPLTSTLVTRRGQRWLRVMGERLTDSAGRPLALRGFVQDISGNGTRRSRGPRLAEAHRGDRRTPARPS